MAQDDKRKPALAPAPPTLVENLSLALKDKTIRRDVWVTLKVRGGLSAKAYRFDFELTDDP